MTLVGICGAKGKMGRRLITLLQSSQKFPTLTLHKAFTSTETEIETKSDNFELVYETITTNGFQNLDVLIDFSHASAFHQYAPWVREFRIPLVIGTTGYPIETKKEIEQLACVVPILSSPNMSLGMNILFELTKTASSIAAKNFSAHIVEAHHLAKKDSPSGSALELAKCYAEATQQKPEIMSLRAGDVVGEHSILFFGAGERIELIHRATSRDIFAHGALLAAEWVIDKPEGLYSMKDLLLGRTQ